MVDKRKPFLIESIQLSQTEVDAVKQLTSASKFFGITNIHQHSPALLGILVGR